MKAYTNALYSIEISDSELTKSLKGHEISEYTNILMNLVLRDTSADYSEKGDYGIYFTDSTAAWNARNHRGEIYHFADNKLWHISGVAIESCEINEDGDFIEGSDYEWGDVYSPENLEELHDFIEK